jgi:phospholipid/cholesterol/gamma-HCH transport system substrate-binding protein
METRARYIITGSFVIVFVAATLIFTIWINRFSFKEGALYYIYFAQSVSGLRENEAVTYNGVPIGTVLTIGIDPERLHLIRVKVEITKPKLIREDSIASLESKGITGIVQVRIDAGTGGGPPLVAKKGEKYPVIKSRRSGLQILLAEAPKLLEKFGDLIDDVRPVFNLENRQALSQTLQNLSILTGELADESINFEGISNQTKDAINRIDKASNSVTSAMDAFHGMVKENRGPLTQFSQTGLNELSKLLTELRKVTKTFERVADNFEDDPMGFLLKSENNGIKVPE